MDRRGFLVSAGAAGVVTLAGCSGRNGETGSEAAGNEAGSETARYGDWFAGTGNFDGTVDKTGADEVTVTVGAAGNAGNRAFEPAAVKVSTGTTITWEWTGNGGSHNVFAKDGSFQSELRADADYSYTQTFTDPGTVLYYCTPHKSQGMYGAVTVVDSQNATETA